MNKLVLFEIGGKPFGLDLPIVMGIHKSSTLIEQVTVGGDRYVREPDGMNMPLYDLSFAFGKKHAETGKGEVVMVRSENQAIGIRVDRVSRVVSVEADRIEPLPKVFKYPAADCFPRVLKSDGELVLLIDPEGIEGLDPEFLEFIVPEPEIREEEDIIDLTEVVEETLSDHDETPSHELRGPVAKLHGEKDETPIIDDDFLEDVDREFDTGGEPKFFSFEEELVGPGDIPPPETGDESVAEPGKAEIPDTGMEPLASEEREISKTEIDKDELDTVLEKMIGKSALSDRIVQAFTGVIEDAVDGEIGKMKKSGALTPESLKELLLS